MTNGAASDESRFLLASLTPTPGQQRTALVVALAFILAFGLAAPFAYMQLRQIEVFIPATQGILCANNLFTAVLLYSQFSMARSSALLVLASGYLFAALILVPHALTLPGAFATSGLLGARENSAPWLYMFWHAGFAAGVTGYALLKYRSQPQDLSIFSLGTTLGHCIAAVLFCPGRWQCWRPSEARCCRPSCGRTSIPRR